MRSGGAVLRRNLAVRRLGGILALPNLDACATPARDSRWSWSVCLAPYAEFHNALTSALDGGGGGAWPSNAVLVAAALTPTALKPGAEDDGVGGTSLAVRFATTLALKGEGEIEA